MIIWITLALIVVILIYHAFKFPRIPDNYLVFLLGKKRSGKSTFLAWCSIHYFLRFRPVYSTSPLPCAKLIDYSDIGKVQFPKHSVILIDEVGMIWDNRNFKNFKTSVRDFFKLQRHYQVIVYLASQSFDIDKKLRDLTDGMILNINVLNVFSVGKTIKRSITLTESTSEADSRIADNLKFRSIFSWKITFIPKWSKYFDSYVVPDLPKLPFREIVSNKLPSELSSSKPKKSQKKRYQGNH